MDIEKFEAIHAKAKSEELHHKSEALKAGIMAKHWEITILKKKFADIPKREDLHDMWDELQRLTNRKKAMKDKLEIIKSKIEDHKYYCENKT